MKPTIPVVSLIILGVYAAACGARDPRGPVDARVIPNDNRTPAGTLRGQVLTLRLEVREARWFPDGDDAPGEVMQVFAEEGRAPQIPGPLIRVPEGTELRVTVRNPLPDSALILYGLHARPGSPGDTLQVAPGGVREVAFTAGEPGTYFYWGTTTHSSLREREGIDSQLHGAFIVDPVGSGSPRDRVFVLGEWNELPDTAGPPPHVPRNLRVINGLSWPHTERFTHTVGDTVRWRWVNPTSSGHPLHLHGIYFDVTSHGTWAADTQYAAGAERKVVTELTTPGETFAMTWLPEEPGNWLMHCHIAFHVSHFLSVAPVPDPVPAEVLGSGAVDHSVHGMRGMILGITVQPGEGRARRPAEVAGARELRLVAQSAPRRYGEYDGATFVLQEGEREPAPDSVPVPGSLLVLRRGEPVKITVVNRLRAPTAVHWHGMELPSYSDGVPGWSGEGTKLAPTIAPGDSFVAQFTPPRAGTFMYHAHSNELFQISLGLYGPLLVVDPERYDPARERLFIVGGNGPDGDMSARVNGKVAPDSVRMAVGETYRLRLMQMHSEVPVWFTLRHGERTLEWRALAKDGADLPAAQQVTGPAALFAGPGETADFEFTPGEAGALTLEVRHPKGMWTVAVPVRVERAAAAVISSPAPPRKAADLVLLGGKVFTADSTHQWTETVAVAGERVVAVGTTEEVRWRRSPRNWQARTMQLPTIPFYSDTAQLRTAAQAVVDAFYARVVAAGLDLGTVPVVEVRTTPQLIFYSGQNGKIVMPWWGDLAPEVRSIFARMGGGDAEGEWLFRAFFHRFFLAHESAHWLRHRSDTRKETLYANEDDANRVAVAFWRTQPDGEAFLAELERVLVGIVRRIPDPTPAGQDPVAFFGANYQELGRDPIRYGYYQFRFVLDAVRERSRLDLDTIVAGIASTR